MMQFLSKLCGTLILVRRKGVNLGRNFNPVPVYLTGDWLQLAPGTFVQTGSSERRSQQNASGFCRQMPEARLCHYLVQNRKEIWKH